MQGEDWSPFVVTDSKMITGQNPQVIFPHTAGNWHTRGCSIALLQHVTRGLSLQFWMLTIIHHQSLYVLRYHESPMPGPEAWENFTEDCG